MIVNIDRKNMLLELRNKLFNKTSNLTKIINLNIPLIMEIKPLVMSSVNKAIKHKKKLQNLLLNGSINDIDSYLNKELSHFGDVKVGLIGTGDKFISDSSFLESLIKDLPDLYAVEMEGAAVAQVCTQESIPFLICRVISDNADGSAAQNFTDFLEDYKSFSWDLIKSLITRLNISPILLKNK